MKNQKSLNRVVLVLVAVSSLSAVQAMAWTHDDQSSRAILKGQEIAEQLRKTTLVVQVDPNFGKPKVIQHCELAEGGNHVEANVSKGYDLDGNKKLEGNDELKVQYPACVSFKVETRTFTSFLCAQGTQNWLGVDSNENGIIESNEFRPTGKENCVQRFSVPDSRSAYWGGKI